MKADNSRRFERARSIFLRSGGTLRTSDAIRKGIHPRTLYAMRDAGMLERLARGLYRLADLPPLGNQDLVSVALKIPRGVICLVSSLAFHGMTTQIPHEVYVALERGAEPPRLKHPPVRVFWLSGRGFSDGVEVHVLDGTNVRIYSPAKTVVDCFKYRNKIGLDVALEALRSYRESKVFRVDELMQLAKVCRVDRVIRPYVEAVL
jgi:predicted transcriptional regulator of viral defense system